MQQNPNNPNDIVNLDNGAISLFYYDHSTDKMIIFDKGETWGIGLNEGFLQLKDGRIHINPSYKDYNTHVCYQSLSAYLKEDYPIYDRLIVAYDDDVKLGNVWRYLFGIFGKIPDARFVSKLHLAAFYNGANLMDCPNTIQLRQGDRVCAIEPSCGVVEILGGKELCEEPIYYKKISDEYFSQEIIAGALIQQHIWEHTTLGNELVFLDSIPFEVKLGIFPDKQELIFPEYTTIPCRKVLEIEKGYAHQFYIKYADEIFVYNIDERFKNDAKLNVGVDIDSNNLPNLNLSSQTHPYPMTVTWDQLIDKSYIIDLREETERENIHESTHYAETEMNDFKTKKRCINALPPKSILHGSSYSYEIVEALGQGSFGISYLANVRLSGALGELQSTVQVAIKEFFMRDTNGRQGSSVTSGSDSEMFQNYRKDFIREANNLARMKHPHIVKVLEAFEANNTCYFSMEYIDGENLDEYIKQHHPLSEREALNSVIEIGEALSFMHERNMLHLDLKPLNVMRHKDGRLVLIDFGLSKQFGENGEPETSTRIGLGTPGYAPLEQANYKKGEGFPATLDIYALGATLFKMLTGKTPPNASDLFNDGFPEDDLRQCGVSEDVISLVSWAMEPMKRERPQTVKAFLDEARRLLPDCSDTTEETTVLVDSDSQKQKQENRPSPNKSNFINGHEFVDLGLSVKWATCNIGAEKPEDYGDYFAWGETEPKKVYSEDTYKHCTWLFNKYKYKDIGENISGTEYDAARTNWGGSWRLPTAAERGELVDKCTWIWTTQCGHNGYKVVGPNGNSIFLPAAGWRFGTSLSNAEGSDYWSSTPNGSGYWSSTPTTDSGMKIACSLYFNGSNHGLGWSSRYLGYSVRPVSE